MGPTTIFDKSGLQALNNDEAVWFDAFFLANVVPIFYVETLADLEKEVAEGRPNRPLLGGWPRRLRLARPRMSTTAICSSANWSATRSR
jgi:hypothetical protein